MLLPERTRFVYELNTRGDILHDSKAVGGVREPITCASTSLVSASSATHNRLSPNSPW